MPDNRQGPRVAHVEDYDDDNNTTISHTRAFASASSRGTKDGSDSGYSSRAGTHDGESKQTSPEVVMAMPIERQRNPYSSGPLPQRQKSTTHPRRPNDIKNSAQHEPEKRKEFCHRKGVCYTCDQLGYHVNQDEFEAGLAKQTVTGQDGHRRSEAPKVEVFEEEEERIDPGKKVRQVSSHKGGRPELDKRHSTTRHTPAFSPAPGPYSSHDYVAQMATAGYAVSPYGYSPASVTPLTPAYASQSHSRGYFDHRSTAPSRPAPLHRNSVHERPSTSQTTYADYEKVYPAPQRETLKAAKRLSYNGKRPEDYDLMPPPPQRPDLKVATDTPPTPNHTHSYSADYKRHDTGYDGSDDYRDSYDSYHRRPADDLSRTRSRDLSPRRHDLPPLSARPKPRQTVSESYTSKSATKDQLGHTSSTRRATQPVTAIDAKLADAEAYQERQGAAKTSHALTHQTKTSSGSKTHTRSESGSNHSHQQSHYSSASRISSKSQTSRRGSVLIETGGKARPVSIALPAHGVTIQIGGDAPDEKPRLKGSIEPKMIEQAPTQSGSTASKSSATRSRAATSDYTTSDRGRDGGGRDRGQDYKITRRISHVIDDSRPPSSPVKMKQGRSSSSTRSGSRHRASSDGNQRR
ncbi:uncharacterized protein AB675_4986 [Cyphellophora attinorum]|uniref:Uncharacterized protein n=1 Tax=Cyphellophora attinorum TaxID=1664694 RepID=A0A0N0NLQ4_9EURO|nr:uncharacterized protein AB675_4986 [Phialophora attinorum]KPI39448.1 hypothetical protein AB675_4986 [Phialophora attinorum]